LKRTGKKSALSSTKGIIFFWIWTNGRKAGL